MRYLRVCKVNMIRWKFATSTGALFALRRPPVGLAPGTAIQTAKNPTIQPNFQRKNLIKRSQSPCLVCRRRFLDSPRIFVCRYLRI